MITVDDVADWDKEAVYAENDRQRAQILELLSENGIEAMAEGFDMGLQIGVMWVASENPPMNKAQRFPLGTPAEAILDHIKKWNAEEAPRALEHWAKIK